jgi:hypothetical protein
MEIGMEHFEKNGMEQRALATASFCYRREASNSL